MTAPAHSSRTRSRCAPAARKSALAAILLLALFSQAHAGEISGRARVIDGDTIVIGATHIRLYGIDAPEARQTCTGPSGYPYACGTLASYAMRQLAERQAVRCEERDRDRYGRTVAVCWAGAVELNRAMVQQGWAVAYRRYSLAYIADENEARLAHRGIWNGTFQLPWDWRRERREAKAR
jgi:endonuclease YncB( thermonuclease family)